MLLKKDVVLFLLLVEDFKNGENQVYVINYGVKLLKPYNLKKRIKWNWQSLESISIKLSLDG